MWRRRNPRMPIHTTVLRFSVCAASGVQQSPPRWQPWRCPPPRPPPSSRCRARSRRRLRTSPRAPSPLPRFVCSNALLALRCRAVRPRRGCPRQTFGPWRICCGRPWHRRARPRPNGPRRRTSWGSCCGSGLCFLATRWMTSLRMPLSANCFCWTPSTRRRKFASSLIVQGVPSGIEVFGCFFCGNWWISSRGLGFCANGLLW